MCKLTFTRQKEQNCLIRCTSFCLNRKTVLQRAFKLNDGPAAAATWHLTHWHTTFYNTWHTYKY